MSASQYQLLLALVVLRFLGLLPLCCEAAWPEKAA
jgi:hypothetical protein